MYIVTGCSSGLGFSISNELLEDGQLVLGLSRKPGKASIFQQNPNFTFLDIDLSIDDGFPKLVEFLNTNEVHDIVLVLNAAKFEHEGNELGSTALAKDLFHTNYFGSVALVNICLSVGLKRVFFVNSIAGLYPQDGQSQYTASKHALQAYSEVLAKFSVGRDFDVMSMNPGGINTELWLGTSLLPKATTDRFLDPDKLAELVCSLLKLPENVYIRSLAILPEHDV